MLLRRQSRRRLRLFLGLADAHLRGLFDHPVVEGIELGRQSALQLQEFMPERFIHKGPVQARHHCGAALVHLGMSVFSVRSWSPN